MIYNDFILPHIYKFQICSGSHGTMDQLKLPDMYTCHLIKLYYKLYRNKLPAYFENLIPEYGESQHDLCYNNIRLPAIKCEFENMKAKYQMHYILREFANPSRLPLYPIVHIDMDTLSQSLTRDILECLIACLSISISILHMKRLVNHCTT